MEIAPKTLGPGLIDAHVHLDDRGGGSAEQAVARLAADMADSQVSHAVVLHLLSQPWSVAEVAGALARRPQLTGFVNVDPRSPNALAELDAAAALGFRGLKLHPRMHQFLPDDPACVALVRRAGEHGWPVTIDCFPDGDWLLAGHEVLHYARLAREAPQARVVVAHAAGHRCLDLLMLAKRVSNLWFDLSYSLLYYARPVVENLLYCVRSIRGERVLFGTDHPDRPLGLAISRSLELLDQHGLGGEIREKLLWKNAHQLLLSR